MMEEKSKRHSIGVDIGGTKTAIVLVDEQGHIQHSEIFKTISHDSKQQLEKIKFSIESICIIKGMNPSDLISIGIGIPGTVDPLNHVVLFAPNLCWENVVIEGVINPEDKVPVYLTQDTHAAAVGEYLSGAGMNCRNVICVSVGTGIGSGIILDGKLYKGSVNAAGEIGHVLCKPDGRVCKCGKRGCLETCASGTALNFSAIENGFCDVQDLFRKADEGHLAARAIIEEAAGYLGTALANAANLLSPDAIIISGGLCEQSLYVEGIKNVVAKHTYSLTANHMRVEKALLGPMASAIGAALLYKVM